MPQTTIAGCQDITDNGDSALPPCLPMSDFTWVCSLYSASSSSSSNHPYYRVILSLHTQLEVWWVASLANTSMYIFPEGLVCLLPLYGMSLAVSYQLHPSILSWYVIHLNIHITWSSSNNYDSILSVVPLSVLAVVCPVRPLPFTFPKSRPTRVVVLWAPSLKSSSIWVSCLPKYAVYI